MRPVPRPTIQILLGLVFSLGRPGPVPLNAQEPDLQPELELLRPFLGGWTGEFQQSDERPQVLRTFTAILGGYAVRETRSVPEAGFEAETLFSYDRESGTVVFLGITNNGYRTQGRMTFDGEVFVQTGDQRAPDGSHGSIRVTFQLREDGSILNRLFNLEGGVWQPSHQILYVRRLPRVASRGTPSSGGKGPLAVSLRLALEELGQRVPPEHRRAGPTASPRSKSRKKILASRNLPFLP